MCVCGKQIAERANRENERGSSEAKPAKWEMETLCRPLLPVS